MGIPYTLMEAYLKFKGLYHHSLGRIMFNRTIYQFLLTGAVLTIIAYVNYLIDIDKGNIDPIETGFNRYVFSATVMFLFTGGAVGNVIMSIFRTLQLKIGEYIFFQLLFGNYRPAKEDNRAFMFLDLKSSTTIAEKLGHEKYSFFIQDCFKDLHPAVVKYKAAVYQYVGDEAVLTWSTEMALANSNCIKTYFAFNSYLKSRQEYYMNKYGVVPEFKAGIHLGLVMVAEVGVVQRDIAYHSDVLNTTARVQGQCNEKNAQLLITDEVVNNLEEEHNFNIVEKGEVLLRGKQERVQIFEVLEK